MREIHGRVIHESEICGHEVRGRRISGRRVSAGEAGTGRARRGFVAARAPWSGALAAVALLTAPFPSGALPAPVEPVPAVAMAPGPIPTHPQAPPEGRLSGARVLEVRTDPETPTFGELFRVHATVRLPRRSDLSLVDTLGSSNFFRGSSPGRFEETPAPGDSVDVLATFSVLPFRDGTRPLPGLLVVHGGAGTAPGMEDPPERLPLGTVDVTPLPGFAGEEPGGPPRPPADVVGGSWSVWALLAGGVVLVGLLGLVRLVLRGAAPGAEPPASPLAVEGAGTLDREAALRRLKEIREAGWHRNGCIDDFYRATTDTLRRFVEGTDPSWSESLTSTELLDRATKRWGPERLEELPLTVQRAEWVKFGGATPGPEEAEGDWAVVRDWIREAP